MKSSRVLAGSILAGSVAVAAMFAAAPASAATLPLGQQISVITPQSQFNFADSNTAALTAVGTGVTDAPEWEQFNGVDVDDNGIGYAISTSYPEGADGAALYAADAKTGTTTYIADVSFFFGDFSLYPDECHGIDWTGGVLTLACVYEGDFDVTFIGVWDFAAGWAVPIVELNEEVDGDLPDGFEFNYISALATNPTTGELYAFSYGFTNAVYTVSEDEGLTYVSSTVEYGVYSADFDRGGQLWVTTFRFNPADRAIEPGESGLATLDPATGTLPFTAAWADQAEFISPITVWGALAATGSSVSATPAIAASAILLLGAILAAGTMVLRRRNADAQV
jgi:hypothetical protein